MGGGGPAAGPTRGSWALSAWRMEGVLPEGDPHLYCPDRESSVVRMTVCHFLLLCLLGLPEHWPFKNVSEKETEWNPREAGGLGGGVVLRGAAWPTRAPLSRKVRTPRVP